MQWIWNPIEVQYCDPSGVLRTERWVCFDRLFGKMTKYTEDMVLEQCVCSRQDKTGLCTYEDFCAKKFTTRSIWPTVKQRTACIQTTINIGRNNRFIPKFLHTFNHSMNLQPQHAQHQPCGPATRAGPILIQSATRAGPGIFQPSFYA